MFPIIPYNLNQNTRTVSYTEVYTNTKLPKVIASCDIPRDTVSEPFSSKLIASKLDNPNIQLDVEINDQKKLSLKSSNSLANEFHWIRAIRLADDCHGYNSRLCYQRSMNEYENPNLFIQITRPIRTGHELLLWFSEDILAYLQMAFLTPTNIQGQKKYVCHVCSTTFEYPNPLKLHLTLDCDKQPISTLWDRLSKSMSSTRIETKHVFGLELKTNEPSKSFKKSYSVLNLSKSADSLKIPTDNILSISSSKLSPLNNTVPNIPTINLDMAAKSLNSGTDIQRSSSVTASLHGSAFKPYSTSRISRNNNSIDLTQSNSNFANFLSNCQPQAVPTIATQNYSSIVDCNHAAQMETLVSNLGKSKQGHLCIYCGKCYSRKYGLKIHIRTHTGYKPLKCKYCLRPFGDPSNLNKHVRLHAEGDTPYKCELCGKVLVRRRDLERHLRSRHMSDMQLEEKNNDTVNSSSDHSDD